MTQWGRIVALWALGSAFTVLLLFSAPYSLVDRDFSNLWVAGRLVLEGRVADIFDVERFRHASHAMLGMTTLNNYSYPPHALFFSIPFALLQQPAAFWLWNLSTAAFFVLAARKHLPEGFPPILAALTPAALACLWFGHYGLLIGGLWFLAFSGSGVSAGLMTIKPHLGLLIAVQMLRDRRALIVAIATALALIALSAALFGMTVWREFVTTTFEYQVGLLKPGAMPVMNLTAVSPILGYGVTGWLAFATAAVILLFRNFNVWTAATATFLIVPYGFHYDLTVACLGFGVIIFTHWSRMFAWERAAVALAFLSPELVIFGTRIVPPLLLVGLWVQVKYLPLANNNNPVAATPPDSLGRAGKGTATATATAANTAIAAVAPD